MNCPCVKALHITHNLSVSMNPVLQRTQRCVALKAESQCDVLLFDLLLTAKS